jgi:hypothetical protein
MAIGVTLFFIVALFFGMFLTEASFLSLKVQEAASSAVWDATGRRVSDFSKANPYTGYSGVPGLATMNTGSWYKHFDPTNQNAQNPSQFFTAANDLTVTCKTSKNVSWNLPKTGQGQIEADLANWYNGDTSVQCNSTATTTPFTFRFFTTLKNTSTFSLPLQLCGLGHPAGGGCSSNYEVPVGDWSLDGDNRDYTSPQFHLNMQKSLLSGPGNQQANSLPSLTNSPNPADVPYAVPAGAMTLDAITAYENEQFGSMVEKLFLTSGKNYGAAVPNDLAGTKLKNLAGAQFVNGIAGTFDGTVYPASWYGGPSPYTGGTLFNEQEFYMSFVGVEGPIASNQTGPGSPINPLSEDIYSYRDRCYGGACPTATCNTCHFNAAGTYAATGAPNPATPSIGGVPYNLIRKTCFLGLGSTNCNLEQQTIGAPGLKDALRGGGTLPATWWDVQ